MGNELTGTNTGTVSVIENHDLGEVIKPLIRDIHLFDTWIAGTTHLEDKTVLETIKPDDELLLRREDNKFDRKAILVLNYEKKKLGYIPEKDNVVFSRLMDAGKILKAKVAGMEDKGSWKKIRIGIYLVDL